MTNKRSLTRPSLRKRRSCASGTTRSPDDRRSETTHRELKHNVVAWPKAAKALKIPTIVTTTERDRCGGRTFELVEDSAGASPYRTFSVKPGNERKVRGIPSRRPAAQLYCRNLMQVCAAFQHHRRGKGTYAYRARDASGTSARPCAKRGLLRNAIRPGDPLRLRLVTAKFSGTARPEAGAV